MTPTEKLQAEAEQLYPDFPNKLDHNGFPYRDYTVEEVRNFQRAAHVACAEKYTAIIGEKDKEIERLQNALAKALEWLNDIWRIVNKSRR